MFQKFKNLIIIQVHTFHTNYIFLRREKNTGWAILTLFFTICPFILSSIVYVFSRCFGYNKQFDHSLGFKHTEKSCCQKFMYKIEKMPNPFRFIPVFQSLYSVSVLSKLSKITEDIEKKKKLRKNFNARLIKSGFNRILGSIHNLDKAYFVFSIRSL